MGRQSGFFRIPWWLKNVEDDGYRLSFYTTSTLWFRLGLWHKLGIPPCLLTKCIILTRLTHTGTKETRGEKWSTVHVENVRVGWIWQEELQLCADEVFLSGVTVMKPQFDTLMHTEIDCSAKYVAIKALFHRHRVSVRLDLLLRKNILCNATTMQAQNLRMNNEPYSTTRKETSSSTYGMRKLNLLPLLSHHSRFLSACGSWFTQKWSFCLPFCSKKQADLTSRGWHTVIWMRACVGSDGRSLPDPDVVQEVCLNMSHEARTSSISYT